MATGIIDMPPSDAQPIAATDPVVNVALNLLQGALEMRGETELLASDLAVRMASDNWQEAAVLPPYRRLVLDEAHHLEDVAAMHLGAQVSMLGVQRLLSRLEKNGRGLLPTLRSVLFGRDDLMSAPSRELARQGLVDALAAARRAADDLFARLARRLDGEPGPAPVLRLSDEFLSDAVWDEGLGVALDNLLLACSRLSEGGAMIADRLTLDDASERRAQLVGELSLASEQFRKLWARHDVKALAGGEFVMRHPEAGEFSLRREKLPLGGSGGQLLVIYHAEPGSASARALSRLAAGAAAQDRAPSRERAR